MDTLGEGIPLWTPKSRETTNSRILEIVCLKRVERNPHIFGQAVDVI